MKRRSGEAQAAQQRKAGPMSHRLEPRGGSRNEQSEYLDDDDEWCYEDSDEECPTGGWLTGNPKFVTCQVCIQRFNLQGERQ